MDANEEGGTLNAERTTLNAKGGARKGERITLNAKRWKRILYTNKSIFD